MNRAVGIEYLRGGKLQTARAAREVVLAGGSINSPQLLLLTGIGPAQELGALGVPVKFDLPGVGKNLQDHLNVNILQRATPGITLDSKGRGLGPIMPTLEFLFRRTGPGTSNVAEAGAFIVSALGAATPDIQYHFIPAQVIDHARTKLDGDGITLHACCLRPQSRGEIRLASRDPLQPAVIDPNYLASDYDLKILIDGIRRGREILAAPAFKPFLREERFPGAAQQSDAELTEFIRATAETEYHPVGTCKMGSDPMAVVDEKLRVHGIDRLRVIDASIMPTVVSGNTNAPVIMIAEKGAEMMLAARSSKLTSERFLPDHLAPKCRFAGQQPGKSKGKADDKGMGTNSAFARDRRCFGTLRRGFDVRGRPDQDRADCGVVRRLRAVRRSDYARTFAGDR